jgi:predicted HAD superfamily Cof-like phosphohydrolase
MTTLSNFQKVCEFNRAFDFPVFEHSNKSLDNNKVAKLRCDLILEESINEYAKALQENDIVEQLDSIADALYVLYGLCYTYSFDPDEYVRLINVLNVNDMSSYEIIKYRFNSTETTIQEIYKENCDLEHMLRKAMLEDKDIVSTYIVTMCMIVNSYKLGILLGYNVDKLFDIVHNSNMSKLCKTEDVAKQTVESYETKIANGDNIYDSPYFYENNGYFIVKNRSTGKSLKSINYTPVKLNLEELRV